MITIDGANAAGDTASALEVLADALGAATPPQAGRVRAAADPRSPEEGLALLSAYVAIEPAALRQAILDVVVTLAARSARPGH